MHQPPSARSQAWGWAGSRHVSTEKIADLLLLSCHCAAGIAALQALRETSNILAEMPTWSLHAEKILCCPNAPLMCRRCVRSLVVWRRCLPTQGTRPTWGRGWRPSTSALVA